MSDVGLVGGTGESGNCVPGVVPGVDVNTHSPALQDFVSWCTSHAQLGGIRSARARLLVRVSHWHAVAQFDQFSAQCGSQQLSTQACVSTVLPHAAPISLGTISWRVRLIDRPVPHAGEHADHSDHDDSVQFLVMGKQLHNCDSINSGSLQLGSHSGARGSIERVRDCEVVEHSHEDQLPQLDTVQSLGQHMDDAQTQRPLLG